MIRNCLLLMLAAGWLLPGEALAQVFGQTARTEFFGGWRVRVFYGRINKTQLLIEGKTASLTRASVSTVPGFSISETDKIGSLFPFSGK